MTPDGRIVHAMVLSGGAAYAAYEVGVMKALARGESSATGHRPLNPTVYVGTSGGAVNAAIMTSRPGQDTLSTLAFLESLWVDELAADPARCRAGAFRIRGDLSEFADIRCLGTNPALPLLRMARDAASFTRLFLDRAAHALTSGQLPIGKGFLEFAAATPLISNDDLVDFISRFIDIKAIRGSDKVLGVVTTNWRTGEIRLFANDEMTDPIGRDAILASTTFPGLAPVQIEGDPYVDGGYSMSTPLHNAISAEADVLHAVFMDPDISKIPIQRFENALDFADKMYQIMQANVFKFNINNARSINAMLDVFDKDGFTPGQVSGILDALSQLQWPGEAKTTSFRQIVIHVYHPREDLGGALGLLNFDRDHISGLIAKGYADAVAHDCATSGCTLPSGGWRLAGYSPAVAARWVAAGTPPMNEVSHE